MTRRVQAGVPTGGQFAAQPRPEADIDLAAVTINGPLEAFRCDSCEEINSDPGEAAYECSRCGGTQVGDNRCAACHVFMAKAADESCESCEELGPLTQVTAFQADGQLFATRAEAEDWVSDAPNREAQKAKAKADLDDYMERRNAEAAARAEALRPRIETAMEIVSPETAPRMHSAISSTGESFGRTFKDFYDVPLQMGEVLAARFPGEYSDLYAVADDYDRDWDERCDAATQIRDAVIARVDISDNLKDRLDDWSPGSAPVVKIEEALDLLLNGPPD